MLPDSDQGSPYSTEDGPGPSSTRWRNLQQVAEDSPTTSMNSFPAEKGIILLTLFLTGTIFLIDAVTPQRLVVSILLDVPIALSALTLRKSVTTLMVLLGLAANLMAGIINARHEGSLDSIAVANRLFSGLSLFLVGYLSIRIQNNAMKTGQSLSSTNRIERAQRMREAMGDIDAETDPISLLSLATHHFRNLFYAKGVLLAQSRKGRWEAPLLQSPESLWFWSEGTELPGALTLRPREGEPVPIKKLSLSPVLEKNRAIEGYHAHISIDSFNHDKGGPVSLHLFILEPKEEDTPSILSEVLPVLEEMLHRSTTLHHLKTRNEQLLRSNDLLRDLVYGFSHDLRTPLVANALNMKLALENTWGILPKTLRPILEQSRRSQESLLDLSNSLIFLSRYELNEIPSEREAIELDQLTKEIFRELAPLLDQKKLNTELDIPPTDIPGDRQAIKRLLTNLIENAIKWSPPEGMIQVSLTLDREWVRIAIADEGPGVPDHVKPFLFKRFGGIHAGGGFGLGVYLADQIARRHGGRISLEPSGKGARFTVTLSRMLEAS